MSDYDFTREDKMKKEFNDFLHRHRIITNWSNLESVPPSSAIPVFRETDHVANYIEDGYQSLSIYTQKSRGNIKLGYRIAMVLAELNREADPQVLCDCMDLLCKLRYDSLDLTVPRVTILNIIDSVLNGETEVIPTTKKWEFMGNLNKAEKRSIVFEYINETRSQANFRKVESAVRFLIDGQSEAESFITVKEVARITELSENTVRKYLVIFRDEINDCNMKTYSTINYNTFAKHESVSKISATISKYQEEQDNKLTRKKVSNRTKLHYNTVTTLWLEDEVQDALEVYNKWKRSL